MKDFLIDKLYICFNIIVKVYIEKEDFESILLKMEILENIGIIIKTMT